MNKSEDPALKFGKKQVPAPQTNMQPHTYEAEEDSSMNCNDQADNDGHDQMMMDTAKYQG